MKHLPLLFFLLCFTFSLFAQKGGEVVHALRLTDGEMKNLSKVKHPAFTIADDNVIRASRGWEILVDTRARAFVFRPKGTRHTTSSAVRTHFSERKDAQFRSFCYCDPNAGGNCKHTQESVGDTDIIRCEGDCQCNSFTIFEPEESPAEVLGPDMNWNRFSWR